MRYEWDDAKSESNIAKHGISFDDASSIFCGFTFDLVDDREDYGEERIISIGMMKAVMVIVVVHTDRSGACRIISARQANRKERARYDQALRQTFDR